jgi:sec-independent protein translocase protein TatC
MARGTKRVSQFERAADGSMTLIEHLRELRGRLFKAALGLGAGFVVGLFFASRIWGFLTQPYCDYQTGANNAAGCTFSASGGPLDPFVVNLKVGLYFGILIGAPVWLYQLWAFIAPGLHRRERRYTYLFVAVAAPLFAAGVILAHLIVSKSLHFFLTSGGGHFAVIVDINGYFSFVTKMMLLFGAAFEFPLLLVMLNFVGVLSAKRMLGWWRLAIFLMFLFGAIVTPTPDPFAMSILAICLTLLYFGAVGVAAINDRRRRRKVLYADVDDDAASAIDFGDPETIEPGERVSVSGSVSRSETPEASGSVPAPRPVDERYDDDAT